MSVDFDSDVQPVVFSRLSLQDFRGFQRRQEFDLSASVVLLRGPNGVGKTSLFDGLQWLLVGELPRLRDARRRRTEEHILNTYATGDVATVSASLNTPFGAVEVTRRGNRSGSVLEWQPEDGVAVSGRAAEEALGRAFGASEEVTLESALTAAGLLQQDAARLVLQGSPKDRFTLFAQLLGLAKLEDFESWTEQRARAAAAELKQLQTNEAALRDRVREVDQRLRHLRLAQRERPSQVEARDRLLRLLSTHSTAPVGELVSRVASAFSVVG